LSVLRATLDAVIRDRVHHRQVFERLRPGFDLEAAQAERLTRGWPRDVAGPEDLYPDARSSLRTLRSLRYRIGVVGNRPSSIERTLRAADLAVDFVASSQTWGGAKPSPGFLPANRRHRGSSSGWLGCSCVVALGSCPCILARRNVRACASIASTNSRMCSLGTMVRMASSPGSVADAGSRTTIGRWASGHANRKSATWPPATAPTPNTPFHAAAARARGLAAADGSIQFCTVGAADMPAPCCARLRHVVNSRDVSRNTARNGMDVAAPAVDVHGSGGYPLEVGC
jgi:hypothetical protein